MIKVKALLLMAILCMGAMATTDGKCRALVLSGGGDKGSYQASVFITMNTRLDAADVAYDVIAGVSVGSLNGSMMATYAPGQEREASIAIKNIWDTLRGSNAFASWPGGILQGLFEEQGIFDESNLRSFFREKLGGRPIVKKISLGSADMNTGTYKSYDYNETVLTEDYVNHVISSTAMPFAFPPILEGNMTLLDGGVVWKMDIPGAIRRCLEIVDDESDIIMDVVMTAESFMTEIEDLKRYSTLEHFQRGQEIKAFHADMKILNNTAIAHPKVNYRYVIGPSSRLTISPIPLDFSVKHKDFCFAVGEKDALNAIKMGPGGYMKLMLEYASKLKMGEIVDFNDMVKSHLGDEAETAKLSS